MRFHIGQKVRVIRADATLYNEVVNITSAPEYFGRQHPNGSTEYGYVYDVNVIGDGGVPFAYTEDEMEPIYDGNQKSTWEKCAWKPSEMHA